jgi:hypothetical protein
MIRPSIGAIAASLTPRCFPPPPSVASRCKEGLSGMAFQVPGQFVSARSHTRLLTLLSCSSSSLDR